KQKSDNCELCEREMELTFHHLIPRKMHDRQVIKKQFDKFYLIDYGCWVCEDCHRQIHRIFNHIELAQTYNTIEKIKAHVEVNKFLLWVSKQSKRVKR